MLVQAALQSEYQDLLDWAEDRATKWFIVTRGHGAATISAKTPSKEAKQERIEDLGSIRDRFFNTLPENRFTPEEGFLREAILNYVDRKGSALYQNMCEDWHVRNAKYECIPATVSLMLWCEKRMGEEVQFEKAEQGHVITRLQ